MRAPGILGIALLASCLASSAFAADRVIQNGIDVWETTDDGSTFVSFATNPIPAGFFCANSEPFTGRIALRGEPLVTGTPGALGRTDTIVQRLDDAAFNKRGQAVTRLQFRALSLKSLAPVETSCGKFAVTAHLDGVQPITKMVILRDNENGGRFSAPLALNVKVSFTPLGKAKGETLEVPVEIRFPAKTLPWRSKTVAPVPAGFVLVDTDGDRVADAYVPGTSNFSAGTSVRTRPGARGGVEKYWYYCHESNDPNEAHCVKMCDECQIP
jgi:hypothetical protein